MKKGEVFIVTGWAGNEPEFTLTAIYADSEKVIHIITDGDNDAGDMIVIANKNSGGRLFIGTTGDVQSFALDIKPLFGDIASLMLGWATTDAQAAFRGEFNTQRLESGHIVFTSNGNGYDVTMDIPAAKSDDINKDTDSDLSDDTPSDSYTDEDIRGNAVHDADILSYYGDTSAVNQARELLGSNAGQAEDMIADMIRSTFGDMIKYRTEI